MTFEYFDMAWHGMAWAALAVTWPTSYYRPVGKIGFRPQLFRNYIGENSAENIFNLAERFDGNHLILGT